MLPHALSDETYSCYLEKGDVWRLREYCEEWKKYYWRSGWLPNPSNCEGRTGPPCAVTPARDEDRQYSPELDGVCDVHFHNQTTVHAIIRKSGEACKSVGGVY